LFNLHIFFVFKKGILSLFLGKVDCFLSLWSPLLNLRLVLGGKRGKAVRKNNSKMMRLSGHCLRPLFTPNFSSVEIVYHAFCSIPSRGVWIMQQVVHVDGKAEKWAWKLGGGQINKRAWKRRRKQNGPEDNGDGEKGQQCCRHKTASNRFGRHSNWILKASSTKLPNAWIMH